MVDCLVVGKKIMSVINKMKKNMNKVNNFSFFVISSISLSLSLTCIYVWSFSFYQESLKGNFFLTIAKPKGTKTKGRKHCLTKQLGVSPTTFTKDGGRHATSLTFYNTSIYL